MYANLKCPGGWWLIVALLSTVTLDGSSLDLRLVEAAKIRDWPRVDSLLAPRSGLDVNAPDPTGATALHWAAHWDRVETVTRLIRSGARVNVANDLGITPLMLACANGNDAIVQVLLSAGAIVDAVPSTGETPLMTAAMVGKLDVVKTLLSHGAAVNAKEPSGQTALMWAAAQGHDDVARVLIAHGADVHARSSRDRFTPLLFAARHGDPEVVQTLLAAGANVNDAASDGASVLLVATVRGHHALAMSLLSQGANPTASDTGYTPLHWLVHAMETELTGPYGIEPEFTEWSALSALRAPTRLDLAKALLANGANPNARLARRLPVIGPTDSIERFPERLNVMGAPPLLLAAQAGDLNVMRLLLANGADPLLMTNDRSTAMMMAAGFGVVEFSSVPEQTALDAVKLLLDHGGDVNAANAAGETALHAAAYRHRNKVIQFLVDKGATVDVKNSRGQTPLAIAESRIVMSGDRTTPELLRKLSKEPR